jgi:hypothetical protein
VASHIGVRGLARSVTLCIKNREFPKRDFPINRKVWVQATAQRTGGIGVRGLEIPGSRESRHHICRFLDREIPNRRRGRCDVDTPSGFGDLCDPNS